MLRRKERDEVHPLGGGEDFARLDAVRVNAGVVGDQPDAFALEDGKLMRLEDVDAELHLRLGRPDERREKEHRDNELQKARSRAQLGHEKNPLPQNFLPNFK